MEYVAELVMTYGFLPNVQTSDLTAPAIHLKLDAAFTYYTQRGKNVCPTYPPAIALLTFDSNNFGLSLNTEAASGLRGSS